MLTAKRVRMGYARSCRVTIGLDLYKRYVEVAGQTGAKRWGVLGLQQEKLGTSTTNFFSTGTKQSKVRWQGPLQLYRHVTTVAPTALRTPGIRWRP